MRHVRLFAVVLLVTSAMASGRADAVRPSPLPPGPADFKAGPAVVSITPPAHGTTAHDPADCSASSSFDGPRRFAFEEPYVDEGHPGHYELGDPFVDCNGNERWDGILLGGGADTPRFPTS